MAYPLATYLQTLADVRFRPVLILGPFDSLVNLPPEGAASFRGPKGAANRLLRWCARGGILRSAVSRTCSWFHHKPGRLYSFVREKPGE